MEAGQRGARRCAPGLLKRRIPPFRVAPQVSAAAKAGCVSAARERSFASEDIYSVVSRSFCPVPTDPLSTGAFFAPTWSPFARRPAHAAFGVLHKTSCRNPSEKNWPEYPPRPRRSQTLLNGPQCPLGTRRGRVRNCHGVTTLCQRAAMVPWPLETDRVGRIPAAEDHFAPNQGRGKAIGRGGRHPDGDNPSFRSAQCRGRLGAPRNTKEGGGGGAGEYTRIPPRECRTSQNQGVSTVTRVKLLHSPVFGFIELHSTVTRVKAVPLPVQAHPSMPPRLTSRPHAIPDLPTPQSAGHTTRRNPRMRHLSPPGYKEARTIGAFVAQATDDRHICRAIDGCCQEPAISYCWADSHSAGTGPPRKRHGKSALASPAPPPYVKVNRV